MTERYKIVFTGGLDSYREQLSHLVNFIYQTPARAKLKELQLVCAELIQNAIKHGNQGRTEASVEMECLIDQQLFVLTVADQGRGFFHYLLNSPLYKVDLSSDGGRGIFLVRNFVDRLCYNIEGNQVRVVKRLVNNVDLPADFNNKIRILILGAGRSGISAANLLSSMGFEVLLSDHAAKDKFSGEISELVERGIELEFGSHTKAGSYNPDFIVISPGIPDNIELINNYRNCNIPVISEMELGYYFYNNRTVGVTGTNGKSTCVSILGELMSQVSSRQGSRSWVLGNIGIPVTEMVSEINPRDFLILEVSSFQLDNIINFRNTVAVITNIEPDHLDRYGSFENYCQSKLRIFNRHTEVNTAVLNADCPNTWKIRNLIPSKILGFSLTREIDYGAFVKEDKIWIRVFDNQQPRPIISLSKLPLKGKHNIENFMAAILAAVELGATLEDLEAGIKTVKALEHRMEIVAENNQISWVNDSKATNISSCLRALDSFSSIIWLAGGQDKGLELEPLLSPLESGVIREAVFFGQAGQRFHDFFKQYFSRVHRVDNLKSAIELAGSLAVPGDSVVLAPACSSYDQFKDYVQRGSCFRQWVQEHLDSAYHGNC